MEYREIAARRWRIGAPTLPIMALLTAFGNFSKGFCGIPPVERAVSRRLLRGQSAGFLTILDRNISPKTIRSNGRGRGLYGVLGAELRPRSARRRANGSVTSVPIHSSHLLTAFSTHYAACYKIFLAFSAKEVIYNLWRRLSGFGRLVAPIPGPALY